MENKGGSIGSIIYIFLKLLFAISLVASITFLAWHFNNPNLMWWYIVPIFAYLSI